MIIGKHTQQISIANMVMGAIKIVLFQNSKAGSDNHMFKSNKPITKVQVNKEDTTQAFETFSCPFSPDSSFSSDLDSGGLHLAITNLLKSTKTRGIQIRVYHLNLLDAVIKGRQMTNTHVNFQFIFLRVYSRVWLRREREGRERFIRVKPCS